ncbi:MAG TPA: acyl-CoA dehydrogenase family protein [Acidimicrobiales bacterium]|nr:acyl-CoA dehydrogenase family protein [Acidimicrobiales bacterium]
MDLEFTTDQIELRDNARSVLKGACPVSLVRAVFEGDGAGDGGVDELWATLVELGWPAIGVPEANGGLGLSFVETGLVVEELARVVAPSPFVATVTQFVPLIRECRHDGEWLARVAEGGITATASFDNDVRAERFGNGYRLDGTARYVMDAANADEIAVVVDDQVFVVASPAVRVDPVSVLDPTLPLAHVTFDAVAVQDERVATDVADEVERARDEATTAMALSVVGTCRVIFEATLEYAKVREQFGKPIGAFQALKHRFAKMYLELEKASSLAYFAALTIAEEDARRSLAASMAKAAASECQRLLVTDGLQLHGGIGFTWENDLHFWLKRAKSADFLLGTGAFHRARVARLLGLEAPQ